MNNYDASFISGCRNIGSDIRSAVADHTVHGAFGVPLSRMGSAFHRAPDGLPLDAAGIFLSAPHFHHHRSHPCVGA